MKILIAIALILNTLFLSGCFSSSQPDKSDQSNEITKVQVITKKIQLSTTIHSHSKGRVKKNSPIVINFSSPIVDKSLVGSSANTLLAITPKIAGEATFKSAQQIEFRPNDLLTSDESYTVVLTADKALTPTIEGTYQFKIQTIAMEYQISIKSR